MATGRPSSADSNKGGNGRGGGAACAYSEAVDKIMSISFRPFSIVLGVAAAASGVGATAAMAAPAASCTQGKPAVLVHVAGLKQARGQLRISLYGSDANRWLVKKGRISKVKVPVTGRAMDVCMPVPAPGRYAVAVHHDFNLNGDRDRQDGGGYSRNPRVSLFNPKPAFSKAAFTVGNGPARVGVTLLYIKGFGVGPAES